MGSDMAGNPSGKHKSEDTKAMARVSRYKDLSFFTHLRHKTCEDFLTRCLHANGICAPARNFLILAAYACGVNFPARDQK